MVTTTRDVPRCTFCGKTEHQVRKLVAGPNASICDECIALCVDIISEERVKDRRGQFAEPLPKPVQIFDYLQPLRHRSGGTPSAHCPWPYTIITNALIWSFRSPLSSLTGITGTVARPAKRNRTILRP